jgi:hypothetical protein
MVAAGFPPRRGGLEPGTTMSPTDTATLRDQFAAQILPAMLIAPKEPGVPRLKMDAMAVSAYAFADAMLRARVVDTKGVQPPL